MIKKQVDKNSFAEKLKLFMFYDGHFKKEKKNCSVAFINVKLATLIEDDPKGPFSIATTPQCSGGRYSISWIAPLYLWSLLYSAE